MNQNSSVKDKLSNHPPIAEQTWDSDTVPELSILCITYNHENFIRDCLDGFLMQETTFPVEVLIHDDASTDGTAEIIREYQQRYPQLIKPVLQTTNQFSQGKKPTEILVPLARGCYIARCEGDDYWTDPKKLQIQFDFLETHPEYVVSGHNICAIDESGLPLAGHQLPEKHKQDGLSEELILNKRWLPLLSMVYRNVIKEYPYEHRNVTNGDSFFVSILGQHGKSKYHTDITPACYRFHPGGIWSMTTKSVKQAHMVNTYYWIYRYYQRIGQSKYADHYFRKMRERAARMADTKSILGEAIAQVLFLRTIRKGLHKLKRLRFW